VSFDVIVIGGGLVGAAAALALARAELNVALVERRRPAPFAAPPDGFENRVYSLTPSVRQWLSDLGVWQRLPQERIAPVRRMEVWGDAGGHIEFDALENGGDTLAYVVEQAPLLDALWRMLEAEGKVSVVAGAAPADLCWSEREIALELDGDRHLSAQLIVGADGAGSWTRAAAGIEMEERTYPQRAIVANFTVERDHGGAALQWFRHDGVLAWLPLPQSQISIVWSANDALPDELMTLDAQAFAQRVERAGAAHWGAMRLASERACFPLRLLRARQVVRPRLALIGDAAHCVHPLAGQGVNLGFEDAACLVQVLAERGVQRDCGDFHLLRRYERARKEDILLMQTTTDGLQRLFAKDTAWLKRIRNAGLTAVGRSGWLKRRLAAHAMA
jgi:ubiquinone biosynthesis UbiH/UbiF/VisC/COQ6 family hydroxylase